MNAISFNTVINKVINNKKKYSDDSVDLNMDMHDFDVDSMYSDEIILTHIPTSVKVKVKMVDGTKIYSSLKDFDIQLVYIKKDEKGARWKKISDALVRKDNETPSFFDICHEDCLYKSTKLCVNC